jgi:outer membrane protein
MNRAACFMIAVALGAFCSPELVRAEGDGPAITCDLQKCIALALEKNPGLQASQAKVDASRAVFDWTKTDYRPRLFLSGGPGAITGRPLSDFALVRGFTEEGIPVRKATGEYFVVGSTLEFPLFHEGSLLGLNAASVDEAKKQFLAEGFRCRAAADKVIQDVTAAFLTVLMDREDVRSTSKSLDYWKLRYDVASRKFALDLVSRSVLLTEASNLAAAEAGFADARQALSAATSNLACAMGFAPETEIVVRDSAEDNGTPVPADVEDLVDAACRNRPELLAQAAAVESARAGLKSVRRGRIPAIDASANYGVGDDFDPPANTLWQVMLRVKLDVADSGAAKARIGEALARVREQECLLTQLRQSIAQEVIQAATDVAAARNRLRVVERQLDASREELKLAKEKFEQSLVSSVDVAGAEAAVVKSEAGCRKARYDLRLKHARLMQAARL